MDQVPTQAVNVIFLDSTKQFADEFLDGRKFRGTFSQNWVVIIHWEEKFIVISHGFVHKY